MMKTIFLALSFFLFSFLLGAQTLSPFNRTPTGNGLIDLYGLPYKNLLSLRTDSLVISAQDPGLATVTRSISFAYGEEEEMLSPIDWVEIRNAGTHIWRISGHTEEGAEGAVTETETLDSTTLVRFRDRVTRIGASAERPDSIVCEAWDSIAWIPMQKTRLLYNSTQKLTRRVELSWSTAAGDWIGQAATTYTYDGSQRVTQQLEETWQGEKWILKNQHDFSYNSGAQAPKAAVWLSETSTGGSGTPASAALTPIDSTAAWYDGEGQPDSIITYAWNTYNSTWSAIDRTVFVTEGQKQARQGKRYRPGAAAAASGYWQAYEETVFTAGEDIYTDQPQEILIRALGVGAPEGQDRRRETTAYHLLSDGRIYGSIQISELQDEAEWSEVFFTEAWFSRIPTPPGPDSVGDRSGKFTFFYTCNLSNPYVQNQTMVFPENDATGDYELSIFSEEGRLVYKQRYDNSGLGMVTAPLAPGFYIVSVKRGNTPLCNQKLIVK